MHIAILNQHHHNPDCPGTCRHYTFMSQLVQRHKISLIASNGWKTTRLTEQYPWVPDGVELQECVVPYANRMGVFQRLKAFAGFAVCAFKKVMQLRKPDVLWAVSTPLSTVWVTAQVARLRGVPWVFEVQDLWPSFPIAMGAVKYKWLQKHLFRIEKSLYRHASHIITLSPDMTDYITGLGISSDKITMNYNGTDVGFAEAVKAEELDLLRQKHGILGKQVVLYAGTFGRANDIPTLIETISRMRAEAGAVFVVTGAGYYEPQLQALAQQAPNLLLLPPQPRPEIFKWFKLASLSLVTFNNLPVLATNSPAKFYDSLACGTPVIVTNAGWTKSFVYTHRCGWYVPAEQPDALSQKIAEVLAQPKELEAAGARGSAIAEKLFDRQQLVTHIEKVLTGVARKTEVAS